jgi:predicted transcriptional regulator
MALRTASIRVDEAMLERLDRLARTMDRSRSWVITQAIEQYLDHEEWFVQAVQAGIAAADRDELIPHEQVMQEARDKIKQTQP